MTLAIYREQEKAVEQQGMKQGRLKKRILGMGKPI